MLERRDLIRSLQILEQDCSELLDSFCDELESLDEFSEYDFAKRWDGLRRDMREVAHGIYDEFQRYSRKQKKLE